MLTLSGELLEAMNFWDAPCAHHHFPHLAIAPSSLMEQLRRCGFPMELDHHFLFYLSAMFSKLDEQGRSYSQILPISLVLKMWYMGEEEGSSGMLNK